MRACYFLRNAAASFLATSQSTTERLRNFWIDRRWILWRLRETSRRATAHPSAAQGCLGLSLVTNLIALDSYAATGKKRIM
jgi:hypothetical protein